MNQPSPVFHRKVPRRLAGLTNRKSKSSSKYHLLSRNGVKAPMLRREVLRRFRRADVELAGDHEAEQHRHERRKLHPERHFVDVMQDVVVRQREQRGLPELRVVLADEVVVEDDAGEQRTDGQQEQRHQHHHAAIHAHGA